MDVVVDTNVLVQYARLDGPKIGALFDYLARTRSRLVVPEVVEQEVRAVLTRTWTEVATKLEKAAEAGRRSGLVTPHVDAAGIVASSLARWEEAYAKTAGLRETFALNHDLLPEVLHRAIHRIAPCARTGEEFRDALIWLGMIDHFRDGRIDRVALISKNQSDFCTAGTTNLAPQLVGDADAVGLTVQYYTSLNEFLRDQAQPIEHITLQWVRERISINEIQDAVRRHLRDAHPTEFDLDAAFARWTAVGSPDIRTVRAELVNHYVWRHSPAELYLFLEFRVRVGALIECQVEHRGANGGFAVEERELEATAEYLVEISAAASEDDTIELIDIESAERV